MTRQLCWGFPTMQRQPSNILQVRKVDKNGLQQEFDSSSLDTGHVADFWQFGLAAKLLSATVLFRRNQILVL
ncbi:hypothetical protein [Acinetobacter sp. MB5]|uniref:hypothetical protein n=1 Tax=Acinetobacter sp. MB5 TaxID=2069438 RepID=UPI001D0D9D9F|nr:hypothetical protein [Acinetobacter sp. MB5]